MLINVFFQIEGNINSGNFIEKIKFDINLQKVSSDNFN